MKSASRRPIGVFDSGIGGLTVLRALARRLPHEDLIYFGDTAHVPYGAKSPEAVTRYSLAVARFLEKEGVKALVVACNTASALALPTLKKKLKIPVLGVIGPGARAAAGATRGGRVGIIGTEATVASGAYVEALRRVLPKARTASTACPLFVPLVEEGWWSRGVTEDVAREYLGPIKKAKVDTLILGCTHYPLLKPIIGRVVGSKIRLIDSAEETAKETEARLDKEGLLRRSGKGRRLFYASDAPKRFLRVARRLGVNVKSVKLHPFDI
jgi:glutamate racemase